MSNVPKLRFKGFVGEYNSYQLNELGEYGKSYPFSRAYEGEGDVHHIHYGDIHIKLPTIISDSSVLPSITEKRDFQYVQVGDIVIADASEDYKDLGKAVCINDDSHKVISGLHTHRFSPYQKTAISDYLVRYMQTERYRRFIYRMGTGVSVLGLSKANLSKFKLNLPVLEEQKKISFFFNELENRIERQQEKIELLKEQKKGYMQKIFNRELRFKDELGRNSPEWEVVKIGDVFSERTEKGNESYELLSVTLEQGVIRRSQIDAKDNSNPNKSKYKVVNKGDIVYNSMRMWQGANGVSNYEGIVSPAYTVLIPSERVHPLFISYLFKHDRMIYEFKRYSQGLTSDTWNLKYPQISEIKVKLPCKSEQKRIGQFFNLIDRKIKFETTKLNEMIQKKKFFMQNMFF